MKKHLLIIFFCSIIQYVSAQSSNTLKVKEIIKKDASMILSEYMRFLSIPNHSSDTDAIKKNTSFIMNMMTNRGIQDVQLLSPLTPHGPPVVYGEVRVPKAKKTLVFYAHYDGQPVNPEQWANGLSPYEPIIYSEAIDEGGEPVIITPERPIIDPKWRIYCRSSSDDKAGVYAILKAYETLIKTGVKLSCNLKFFFEGEEEVGSPHLDEILNKYSDLLQSDLWIICDGPVHQSGKKQIAFGVRGDTHIDLTVFASKRPLHSGHYGNWAPNPALRLAKLLASMKDAKGKVTIEGFYDDVIPLTALEQKVLKEVPSVEEQMKNELGIIDVEMPQYSLSEAINLPSLNINGMQSGNVGKMASNQIPTHANVVLDLRLVLGNDWRKQQQKVVKHIQSQGYFVTDHDPSDEERKQHVKIAKVILGNDGYNAQRTSINLQIAQQVINAVKSTTKDQIVIQPTMGGSLPLFLFEKHLKAKTITVPIANHDNNQHAENENIRIQNLFEGIETMVALMAIK